jgi:hypothetical protein
VSPPRIPRVKSRGPKSIDWPGLGALGDVGGGAQEWSALAAQGWSAVGWVEPGSAVAIVADGDLPAAFVDGVVVVGAEQEEFASVGATAVCPVVFVVDFAVGRGSSAAGEDAAAVAGDDEVA